MAGGSLLTLIDDIATLLDDVAVLAKAATKKTSGVLGDDLALNAEQVVGVTSERELPVVWAVAKGSAKNKLVIVPAALAISAIAPWAITPLLMLGGGFLCFEGFEKIAHKFLHGRDEDEAHHREQIEAIANPEVDMVAFEKAKIRGAIRTDIILSAEIVVITLGIVADETFATRLGVLTVIAALMTVGVYGFVAGIVKLDDAGVALTRRSNELAKTVGRWIVRAAPWLMKTLSVAGTVAMFLVGGGILTHGVPPLHHLSQELGAEPGVLAAVAPTAIDAVVGLVTGALLVAIVTGIKKLRGKS